ncbi:MAG: AMP-binding protein, partial [bacterium]|nr:AMP-binding protein [bacterium]
KVAELEVMSTTGKRRILETFNATDAEYPLDKTLHALFEEQTARRSHHPALVPDYTYAQLNERADGLASLLISKGVKPGSIVGIMGERGVDMVTGILAILKAGGAYMPIDPGYPEERIHFMLKDSGAKVLLKSEIQNQNSHRDQTAPNDEKLRSVNHRNKKQGFPCIVLNFEHSNLEYCSTFR